MIGPSVNLAARLVDIAGPGEIVIDDEVHTRIESSSVCVELQDLSIKGIEKPVTAWRVVSYEADARDAGEQPMVGRRHELAQLAGALDACIAGGAGSVMYLRGDPGIGKSRLVSELMRMARGAGFVCHRALVLDSGTARERDAIREVLTGLLDVAPDAGSDPALDALARAVERGHLTPAEAPLLAGLLDLPMSEASHDLQEAMDPGARERAATDALVHLLGAVSRDVPRVVAIEDVHWADEPTLRRIAQIARAASTLPLLVVLTSRTDGDPLSTPWRTSLRAGLTSIDLGPLSDEDAGHLAGTLVAVSERFARKCVERAAGNPLFLEQLLRAAHEHEDRLPASLHSLVLARVDRLPERERSALRAASVIGQRFPLTLVRHLCGFDDFDCTTLVEHHLVQSDGADFLFGHALIRDGIYASVTHARRKTLHAQVAEWYRERDPALYAEHLARSESPDAPAAYRAAAEVEYAALRPERALALADRGVTLAKTSADICALQLLRVELLKEIGEGKRVSEASHAALAAASAPGERCRALLGVAAGHRLTGEVAIALDALAEAETLAQAAGYASERMAIHYLRGNLKFAQSRFAECRAEHARAYEQARALHDTEHEARTLSGLADADYAQALIRSALARVDACLQLCDAHGLVRIAIPNRVMRGHCRTYLCEFEAGLQDMRTAADLAVQVGNRHGEMFALQSMGVLYTGWGRCAEAEPSQARAVQLARELGARRYLATILAHQAESLFERGDVARARDQLHEALDIARASGAGFSGPMVLGMLLRVTDDPQERAAYATEAEQLLAAGCISHSHVYYRRYGMEDALVRGYLDEALSHAAALDQYTRADPLPYTNLLIRRARAVAALARAPHDAAMRTAVTKVKADAEAWRWPMRWPV